MIPGFSKIVEQRIKKAQKNGAFDNLSGVGKRLKLSDDRHIPEELRIAYKILKNADCLPPEIELKKEIIQAEELLAGMEESAEKYHMLKKINFLIMRLNSIRGAAIRFEMPQKYENALARRFDSRKE
ncbi:DnaJ family domain-containing protein [Thermodesulfobacteriota bacterium]